MRTNLPPMGKLKRPLQNSLQRIQSTASVLVSVVVVEFIVIVVACLCLLEAAAVARLRPTKQPTSERVLFGSLALEEDNNKEPSQSSLSLLLVYFKSNYTPPRNKQAGRHKEREFIKGRPHKQQQQKTNH